MRKRKFKAFFYRLTPRRFNRRRFVVFSSRQPDFSVLPKFLTIRQTAKLLDVHPNTLRTWDRNGKLRAVRFGTRHDRRYFRDEVAAAWMLTNIQRPLARFPLRLPRVNQLRPILGVALMVFVIGISWSQMIAVADEPKNETVSALPKACQGWAQASAATTIDVETPTFFEAYSTKNAAVLRSQDLGVSTTSGLTSASFDGVEPQLECQQFSFGENIHGALHDTTIEIFLATKGEKNSTDSINIAWSLDGETWSVVATEPVQREEQRSVRVDLPLVTDVQQLENLRIRITPDFSLESDSTVFVDGMRLVSQQTENVSDPNKKSIPARQKELDRLTTFSRESYESTDQPEVTIPKQQTKRRFFFVKKVETWKLREAHLIDAKGDSMTVDYRSSEEPTGDDINARLRLRMSNQHPGKYTLVVTMVSPTGTLEVVEEPFFWGVLAVNFRRANPKIHQAQEVAIAVLDDTGRTICDARVQATIIDPKGKKTQVDTKNTSISTNPNCVDKGVTNEADYHFPITLGQVGVYHVSVKADTTVGQRRIEENFIVEAQSAYDVERVDYPTRIYPLAKYPVRIAITPERDYIGLVTEEVPTNFDIRDVFPSGSVRVDGTTVSKKIIEWLVEWKAGETYYLSYTFDAPDVSPALFLTGPLTVGGSFIAAPDFQESRQWQIASDAISYTGKAMHTVEYVLGGNASGTATTDNTTRATTVIAYAGTSWSTTSTTTSNCGVNAGCKNIIIKGSGIRVTQAYLDINFHINTAGGANDLTDVDVTLDVEGSVTAGSHVRVGQTSGVILQDRGTSDLASNFSAQYDATALFDRQSDSAFNSGLDAVGSIGHTGATRSMTSMRLVVTYESDYSTTSHQETKTVRFPLNLDGVATGDEGSKTAAGLASTAYDFNYIADMPDLTSSGDINDVYVEIHTGINVASAMTITPRHNNNGTLGTNGPAYTPSDTIGGDENLMFLWRPTVGTNDFNPTSTITNQNVRLTTGTTVSQTAIGGEVVVTYNYDVTAATQVDTVQYFMKQQTASTANTKTTDAAVAATISNGGLSVQNIWYKVRTSSSELNTLTVYGTVGAGSERSSGFVISGSASVRVGSPHTMYLDLTQDAANFSSATTNLDAEVQWTGGTPGTGDAPVNIEAYVTFKWSGSSGGTQTNTIKYARAYGGAATAANEYFNVPLNVTLSEDVAKTYRSAYLVTSVGNHQTATTTFGTMDIGVNVSLANANRTAITEPTEEGTTTTGEGYEAIIMHDVGSSVFSDGATIGWKSRTFEVTGSLSVANETYRSNQMVVTYDAAYGNADPQAPTANKAMHTIEYVLGGNASGTAASDNTSRATNTTEYAGTSWSTTSTTTSNCGVNAGCKNIIIKGSGLRVAQAYLDINFHLIGGNNDLTDVDASMDVEGSATAGSHIRIGQTSAVILQDRATSDLTSNFTAQYDATALFDRQSDSAFNSGLDTVASVNHTVGNVILTSARLVITYESDYVTTSHQETKTVRFPLNLDGVATGDEGSKTAAAAASTAYDFGYIADMPDLASNSDINDVYVEIHTGVNSTTAGTITPRHNNNGTLGTNGPTYTTSDTAAGDENIMILWRPTVGTNDFNPTGTITNQSIRLTTGATVAQTTLGGEVVVTYNYDVTAATQVDTVQYFMKQQTASTAGTKTTDAAVSATISNTGLSVQNIWYKVRTSESEANVLTVYGTVGAGSERSSAYTVGGSNTIRVGSPQTMYLDLTQDAANFSSATTNLDAEVQWTGGTPGTGDAPVNIEAYVTFKWSGSSGGTQTNTIKYARAYGGAATVANEYYNTPLNVTLSEDVTKTYRSAYLITSVGNHQASTTTFGTMDIGVNVTLANGNRTAITEPTEEGTTTSGEGYEAIIMHDVGSSVFSDGATIGWKSRTFEVTGSLSVANETYRSNQMVVTYDAAYGVVTIAQNHFRWRDDTTALNTDGGYLASQDSTYALAKATTVRLRVEVANTGGAPAVRYPFAIDYGVKSSTCSAATYVAIPVTPTTEHFELVASGQYADQASITASRLTATGTFVNGVAVEDPGSNTNAFTLPNGNYTELEFALQATTNATDGGSYCFRITNLGSATNFTYTTYAEASVASASITVSGGCFTDATEGTACTDDGSDQIKVAVNGTVDSGVDTTVDGSWTLSIAQPSANAILVIFRDGEATAAEEATTVVKYDGTGDVTNVKMYQSQLVIGTDSGSSNSDQTLAVADLDTTTNGYENSDDEDVIYDVTAGSDLTVDAEADKTERLYIMNGETFQPASGGGSDTTTHHLEIDATAIMTADSNAINVAGDFLNAGTFTSGTSTLTMNGTGTLTSNGNTINNFATSGGGTVTLANATHTFAGDVTLGSTGLTAGTSTVVMTGTKNLVGGGKTLNNLTIDGTNTTVSVITSDLTVSGTLTIGGDAAANTDVLSIANAITVSATGTTTITDSTDTVSGAGTLRFVSTSSGPGTTGTLSSRVLFAPSVGNNIPSTTVDARTYGGAVIFGGAGTATLPSGTFTFSSSVNIAPDGVPSSALIVDASNGGASNPTINISGNLSIDDSGPSNDATFISGTGTITVGGNVDFQYGAYTATSGNTLAMNGTSKTLYAGGNSLYNLTISGGSVTNTLTLTVANNYNQTAGTFTHAANTTMTVTGTSFTIANGATWTKTSGTGKLVLDNVTNLAFADNNATKQNLGVVQVGASPGTVTLTTDMSADTVTIPTGDTFNTKGYDVTSTGAFACNGTCALDMTDSGGSNEGDGTILDVGGDFTMSSTGTLTAATGKVYLNSTSGTDTNRTFTTGGKAYNDVELKNAGATNDDITISGTPFDINGTLTLTDGQVRLDTNDPNVTTAGSLSINANATVTKADNGTSTWTFDGSGTSTWTDGTGSGGQDLGLVHINGTTKTVNLASSAKATKLIIAASQTFGLGSSAYVFTLTGSGLIPDQPLQNSGTLNEGSSSTVKFTGTSDSDIDPESFHNLEVSASAAGSPVFTVDSPETGNPLNVAGTLVVGDTVNATTLAIGAFCILTVSGDFTISTGSTFVGPSENAILLGSSYLNNGTFTDGAGVEFFATTSGKTIAGNLTSANKFLGLYFTGSGGEWTNTSALEANSIGITAGTFTGSSNVTVFGSVTGSAGVINRTGGTFTQNFLGGSFFGMTTASTAWTFNNLTITTGSGSQVTDTVSTCATCTYTVNGAMSVDTNVTLTIVSSLWTIVGSLTTTTTGAIGYSGTPTVTVQGTSLGGGSGNIIFYNLTKSGAGTTTWSGTGYNVVRNTLTLSAGTLVAPSNTLYVKTYTESGGSFTHNSGTVMFNTDADQTLTAATTFNNATFNDGLVGYWNLDETAGTSAADSSGYGHTGSHTNTPTISTDVPTVNFTNPRSLDFNGSSQYVDLGTAPFINSEFTDKITLSAWIKPNSLTGDHVIVGKSFAATHGSPFYEWNLFQSGSIICFRVGTSTPCSGGGTLTTGWQLITGVYDGANMYLYRNGTQVATTSKTGNVGNGPQSARIAGRDTPTSGLSEYFAGKIDDVRIYRRALSSGEVTTLSNGDEWGLTGATWTLGADLTVAGNLGIKTGTLDTHVTNNRSITVGSSWLNDGGVFTARAGTVTMNAGSSGKTITAGQQSFYLLNLNNASGGWTMSEVYTTPTITVSNNMVITAGTLTALAGTLSVGGDFNNAGTFTHNSGTVTMTGSSKNITGGSATTFNNLTISGTTGIDAAGSDATVASLLTVDNTKTLTINTGRIVTLSGTSGTTLSLVGTITGAGRLTYKNNATAFPATGTISSILRMDATAGDQSIGGTNSATRTFGGLVEIYSNSAGTAKTVTLENGTARTFAFSGNLHVIADNTQNLTLTADTATDPTVTVAGDLDFTGTGGGSESITSGSGTWTVTGNVDFTDGSYTATTGNTLTLNGTVSTTLNSACSNTDSCTNAYLYNLTINKTDAADANDNVTLTTNGIRLANLLTITDGELIQGTLNVRAEGASAVSVASAGKWTNISTGDLKLGGTFVNAGSVTFNSNNGTQCADGANDIAISSTSGGSQRTWSGAGTYVLYNLDVTDMADSAITAYNSTYSNTTWSVGSCGITISGTVFTSANEGSAYDCTSGTGAQLDLVVAVNGDVTPDTGACTSGVGTFSFTATDPGGANVPIALYVSSSESEKATLVTLSNAAAANITGLSVFLDRVTVSQQSGTAITNTHLKNADNGNAGVRYNVVTSGTDNLTVESGMELHVLSGKTFTPGGTVTTTATGTAAGPAGDLHIAGTLTMGTNALTVGGDYNNAGTFNKTNTQTTTLAAIGTGFTITPGTGDMNNLTVSGDAGGNGTYTVSGADLTVDGALTVNTGDTLSIDTSRTLTNSGSTEASIGGTISGAGTLRFVNGSGGPGTGGTLSSITRFDASSGDIAASAVDARTYSGKVELYASSSSDRTITLPSSTITLSGSSSHLHMKADGAGDLTVDGAANNPTVTVGGDIALNGTGTGIEAWVAGDNTWTSSGNVDTAQGFYAPRMAVLNPTWDNFGYEQDDYADDGLGGCDFLGTTSDAGSSSSTDLSQGVTTGASSICSPTGTDFRYRSYLKFNLSGVSNTNTITRADLQLYASSAAGAFSVHRSNNDAPDGVAAGSLYAVGVGTGLNGSFTYGSGTNLIPMALGGTADLQASLGNAAYAMALNGGTGISTISSVDSATNKPKLRIGYFTTATTPTLVMNGTGTLSSGTASGYYNLTMSGTNTFNAVHQVTIYNTLDLTGSTITTNAAPIIMAGSASTVIGGNNTLGNLTVNGGTTTLSTSDLTTSLNVQLLSSGTLSIASGRTFTAQGNVLLNSGTTISGAGTLTMTTTSSGPGTAGTLSSLVRYDATGGNIANTTLDARTYGGAVEFYSNSGSARTATAPSSGTFTFSSSVTTTSVGGSTLTLDLDDTTDPTVTIAGATTLGANTTLQAPSGTTLTLNGNYTNNGTFTDNSGTVALSGSAQQTLSGTMTGSSDFNNLTVTNASGSNPESSPSVIFGAAASAAGTFTATTADTKLRFASTATYTFVNVTLNGQAVGTRVYLRSSSTGTQWNLVSTGTQTVSNTDVRDSYACGGDTIDAIDGTSQDSTHNDCWNINTISMSISDTTIGFGACTTGSARYATGDTNGSSSDSADAHTINVATNARGGYSLTVIGSTLTGTGGTITALGGSAIASSPGSEQFGLRAIKNSGTGTVSSPFDTANWAFTPSSTQAVASYAGSATSYSAAYGLRYLCNVSGITEAGSYSTDLTFILTSTF